jgi:peptide/nickel transport system permease protein
MAQATHANPLTLPLTTTAVLKKRPRFLILRSPLTVLGLILISIFVFAAIAAPVISPYAPDKQALSQRLKPPNPDHLLGTDNLGRDVLSRMIYGAQNSLKVGIFVVISAGLFGTVVGMLAGYFSGWSDELLMRVTDIFFAFPGLILAMAIAAALGQSLENAMIAIAVVSWPVYARLIRGQVLSLRQREFIEAARCIGVQPWRIMFRHLLPNTLAPLLVQGTFDLGGAILTAAGLGFIGFGAQVPIPEWGRMIADARNAVTTQPWLPFFPGFAILLTVAAFNLIGDGLRDVLDPRLRGNL